MVTRMKLMDGSDSWMVDETTWDILDDAEDCFTCDSYWITWVKLVMNYGRVQRKLAVGSQQTAVFQWIMYWTRVKYKGIPLAYFDSARLFMHTSHQSEEMFVFHIPWITNTLYNAQKYLFIFGKTLKFTWATKNKPLTVHYTGCSIGILIMVHCNPDRTG